MKARTLIFLFIFAFVSGILSQLYTSDFVNSNEDVVETIAVVHQREIPVSVKKVWGRDSERIRLMIRLLDRQGKKEGREREHRTMEVRFFLACQNQEKNSLFQRSEECVTPGDFILYPLPKKFTLGTHFPGGVIRKEELPIAAFERVTKRKREYVKITFTEYAVLFSYFGDVSGKLVLEMDAV